MLYWNANFQIPNSGVQTADVYAVITESEVNFYSDREMNNLLFQKTYVFPSNMDRYDYLLSLDEFSLYVKI